MTTGTTTDLAAQLRGESLQRRASRGAPGEVGPGCRRGEPAASDGEARGGHEQHRQQYRETVSYHPALPGEAPCPSHRPGRRASTPATEVGGLGAEAL
eukprot:CAMPEP_0183505748 /NCGR_PEP_ID=MMETSP0371-20130417/6875_1 /TAXON_ID=268820 /ORGANISM="Peridinium aciculiferum, Strain PAER-2" /LENGTH=97 /DNA_ID=CAMNT_0025701495 /DNA_START=269 /DNA_END=558 /DNA_ORIENTATION=+